MTRGAGMFCVPVNEEKYRDPALFEWGTIRRFWSYTYGSNEDECWPWQGSRTETGYGQFGLRSRPLRAHRVAYIYANGLIPDGLVVDHICQNRACVNPAHLRAVTERVNILENSNGLAAANAAKTHCKRGHLLCPENLEKNSNGYRSCKICRRAAGRIADAKRRPPKGRKRNLLHRQL